MGINLNEKQEQISPENFVLRVDHLGFYLDEPALPAIQKNQNTQFYLHLLEMLVRKALLPRLKAFQSKPCQQY